MATRKTRRKTARKFRGEWWDLPRQELLDLQLRDLDLAIEGTWLEELIEVVLGDLEARGLEKLKPHFWLSDEWFCPRGVTGIAIPFYLAHPRLIRLERSQMFEVEGGTRREALKILRHELGHVMDHAFGLDRRKRWQELFGYGSEHYPDQYRPNPASRHYVQHLDDWYAQAHPAEDFAETFAVWLTPRSAWRKRYKDWPALEKLEYVDELMEELVGEKPRYRKRVHADSLPRLRQTLREYYEEKKARYVTTHPDVYDRELRMIFTEDADPRDSETAAAFLRRNRGRIRRTVAKWTGEYEYTLDHVFRFMIGRCKELKLRAVGEPSKLRLDFAILLTVKSMHHLYEREWIAM